MALITARALRLPGPSGAARFFLVFLIGNVLVTALVSLLLYAKAPSELETQTIDLHRTMLLQASRSLDTALIQTDLFLQQLAVDESLADIPRYKLSNDPIALLRVNEELNRMRLINRHVRSMTLYYPEEGLAFIPNAGLIPIGDAPEAALLTRGENGEVRPGWLPAHRIEDIRTGNRVPVISVVKYLNSTAAGKRPFVAVNIDEEYLRYLSGSFAGVEATELLLVSSRGEVLSTLSERGYWSKLKAKAVVARALELGNSSEIVTADQRYLFTAATSDLDGRRYVSILPLPAISSQIRFLRTYSFVVIVFGIASSLAFSFFFSRRINALIAKLLALAKPSRSDAPKDPLESLEDSLRELRDHSEALEANLSEQLPILRNHAMENLFRGQLNGPASAAAVLASYGIDLKDEDEYFCLVVALQDSSDEDPSGRSRDLSAIVALDLIAEALPSEAAFAAAFTASDELTLLIGAPPSPETEEAIGCRVFDAIERQIKPVLGVGALAGQGDTHKGLSSAARSYREARETIRRLRFSRGSGFAAFCEIRGGEPEAQPYSFDDEEALIRSLRRGDRERTLALHEAFRGIFAADPSRRCAMQLLAAVLRTCSDMELPLPELSGERNPYAELSGLESEAEIDARFLRLYESVFERIATRRRSRNRIVAEKVADFVRLNYGRQLSLTMLSREVYLSEAYLSRIFHEEMGQPLKQYINAVRVEEAKKMLADTGLLVAEVGKKVGYDNAHGFMKFFKEQTGMSPKEYRSAAS